jgi:hypothetical protein
MFQVSGVRFQFNFKNFLRSLKPKTWHLFLHLVFSRLDQKLQQLIKSGVSAFVDFFQFYRTDRMLDDQHRVIRRAKRFFL